MPVLAQEAAGIRGFLWGPKWNRRETLAFQSAQLRALVRHAYDRVPHYRRLFDQAGLNPDRVRALEDLRRIPISTRDALQGLPAGEVIAEGFDPRKLLVYRTSGSTGQPLSIRRTWFEDRLLQAHRLRLLRGFGFRFTDRRAAVVTPRMSGAPLYMRLGLLRYEEIHCLLPPREILSRLRAIRPDVLRGFPGTLSWLSGYLTAEDRGAIRPRFITTDSETLTNDMRAQISAAFRAPVIDFYDSHEFNVIAWECPAGHGYHVSDPTVIAEVLQDGRPVKPGEDGELVGTALHSWAMPLIRFWLGDQVTRGADGCPCGAPNSNFTRVIGRTADRFVLPSGASVHPYTLVNPLLKTAPWLRRYQIVQEQPDRIRVRLTPLAGKRPGVDELAGIRQVFGERLGPGVSTEVEVVDEIPPGPSGKFRPYFTCVPRRESSTSGSSA